ncbi:hypothetical protein L0F63_006971 [Massospora cicadina]|nr:hypothetical protein L0F63_006971 [Massospora cicadina]
MNTSLTLFFLLTCAFNLNTNVNADLKGTDGATIKLSEPLSANTPPPSIQNPIVVGPELKPRVVNPNLMVQNPPTVPEPKSPAPNGYTPTLPTPPPIQPMENPPSPIATVTVAPLTMTATIQPSPQTPTPMTPTFTAPIPTLMGSETPFTSAATYSDSIRLTYLRTQSETERSESESSSPPAKTKSNLTKLTSSTKESKALTSKVSKPTNRPTVETESYAPKLAKPLIPTLIILSALMAR